MIKLDTDRPREILDALRARLDQDKRDAVEEHALKAQGWFRVLDGHTARAWIPTVSVYIRDWLHENCVGAHRAFHGRVCFETEADAIAFRFTFT